MINAGYQFFIALKCWIWFNSYPSEVQNILQHEADSWWSLSLFNDLVHLIKILIHARLSGTQKRVNFMRYRYQMINCVYLMIHRELPPQFLNPSLMISGPDTWHKNKVIPGDILTCTYSSVSPCFTYLCLLKVQVFTNSGQQSAETLERLLIMILK